MQQTPTICQSRKQVEGGGGGEAVSPLPSHDYEGQKYPMPNWTKNLNTLKNMELLQRMTKMSQILLYC